MLADSKTPLISASGARLQEVVAVVVDDVSSRQRSHFRTSSMLQTGHSRILLHCISISYSVALQKSVQPSVYSENPGSLQRQRKSYPDMLELLLTQYVCRAACSKQRLQPAMHVSCLDTVVWARRVRHTSYITFDNGSSSVDSISRSSVI